MPTFKSFDEVKLHYEVTPARSPRRAEPVMLLHGYASDSYRNWVRQGIANALTEAGFELVLLDSRGHGKSEKPHDAAAYEDGAMAKDASILLDLLTYEAVHLIGYSMGARNALKVAEIDKRVRSVVAGGVGSQSLRRMAAPHPELAAAMLAEDPAAIRDERRRAFREFADLTRADLRAMAAIAEGNSGSIDLSAITAPVLLLVGSDDILIGTPDELSKDIPNARVQTVPGDHLTAIAGPEALPAILHFLETVSSHSI